MSREGPVLVFVEPDRKGGVLAVSLECLAGGRVLADGWGAPLAAVILGRAVGGLADTVSRRGADAVYVVDDPLLETYHPELHTAALIQVCERIAPVALLLGDSLVSVDLAPRAALALEAGLVTDCVGVEFQGGQATFLKPVYSGNVMAAYTIPSKPCVLSMRARVQEPAGEGSGARAEIHRVEVRLDPAGVEMEVLERVMEEDVGPDLTSCDVIVAGGRGMGGPEGFALLSELADVLGAGVGASRPPCDLGWVSPKAQVGQTGEKVGPSVYIAVGISGATQHVAGMHGSRKIVAVNRDPKAGIFRMADYGVVGPYEEVIPAFRDALRGMKAGT